MSKNVLTLDMASVRNELQKSKNLFLGKKVWGVPRGGMFVALLIAEMYGSKYVDTPDEADLIVDDIIDSGRTKSYFDMYHKPMQFFAPYDKTKAECDYRDRWLVFPWEQSLFRGADQDREELVVRQIQMIGDDVSRDGLTETPQRVVRSWGELYSGYASNTEDVMKWFKDDTDEMVIVRDVQYYSTCEHHLLPFFGTVDIAYVPAGAVLGVSKVARLVDVYARRLQVQERLARQIGEALQNTDSYPPLGVAVHMKGQHLCMMARGVRQQQAELETNYLTGIFRTEPSARAEFFARTK